MDQNLNMRQMDPFLAHFVLKQAFKRAMVCTSASTYASSYTVSKARPHDLIT